MKIYRLILVILLVLGVVFIGSSRLYPSVAFLWVLEGLVCFAAVFYMLVFKKTKKHEKLLRPVRVILIIGAVFVLVSFIVVQTLIQSHEESGMEHSADVVIVLGAGLIGDKPSWTLQNRLLLANEYLQRHPEAIVIVTGGQGPDEWITEARAMETFLVNVGIEKNRIIKEDESNNTVSNLKNAMAILEEKGMDRAECMIISSSFHLYRAELIAKQLDFDITGTLGADIPDISGLKESNYLREYFSVMLIYLKILVGVL